MLHVLWAGMILTGVLWGAACGRLEEVTEGALGASKEAVALCITMLGVMSLWTGILEIGRQAGLIENLSRKMHPLLRFLFPRLSLESPAAEQISVNLIANVLGLGWAATPAGLAAMKELEKEAPVRGTATNEMCTFLILNISSLQLIPINMIACRSQYGSANPAAIAGPAMAATAVSTLVAVIFCKVMDRIAAPGK
jgi:spore maturation protein A